MLSEASVCIIEIKRAEILRFAQHDSPGRVFRRRVDSRFCFRGNKLGGNDRSQSL